MPEFAPLQTLASRVVAHASPMVLVISGGGSAALAAILGQPGASRVVLEAGIPYCRTALAAWLGQQPVSLCSVDSARRLAWRAWERACFLSRVLPAGSVTTGLLGVSCTAALTTQPPRRGADRAHLAICDGIEARCWTLDLAHDDSRSGQEAHVAQTLLGLLAGDSAVGASLTIQPPIPPDPLAEVLTGVRSWCRVHPDGRVSENPAPGLVIAGSFHPLHAGHVLMARVAERRTGLQAVFELTVANADKPHLGHNDLLDRLAPFGRLAPVVVSRLGTFEAKASAWPGATFVVGIDTALRVVDPRFYGGTLAGLRTAMGALRELGCRFLVAGRATEDGLFRTVDSLLKQPHLADVPDAIGLFEGIPESEFRLDLSSSEIRSGNRH